MLAKDTPIIIIGLGSIGTRHTKNLLALGFSRLAAYDPNLKTSDVPWTSDVQVELLTELSDDTLKRFTVAFITAPTHLHLDWAMRAARAGCHLFIEKPLSHTLEGLPELERTVDENRIAAMVACNMRFHPCLTFIKNYLDTGFLGKVYSIHNRFGYYLPFWRGPEDDYRKNYAAKKETGGGIILDDIHEFDLLFWLNGFAPVSKHALFADKVSNLEIETEDQAVGVFHFKNGVLGTVRSDYLSKKYVRACEVAGEKGALTWDFNENVVWLYSNERKGKTQGIKKKLFSEAGYDTNQMYADELRYFFECVEQGRHTFNDIARAATVLRYCLNRS